MTGRSHMKIAFSVTLLTGDPILIASAVIASLLPDVDTSTSIISSMLPFHGWPLCKIKHRGFTHSIIATALITLIVCMLFHFPSVTIGLAIGYLSHIIADMVTPSGVQLLWPKRKKYRIGLNIVTGSTAEYCIANCSVIFAVCAALKVWNWIQGG